MLSLLLLSLIFFGLSYYMDITYDRYTMVDSLAGMLFVFFLTMIVSLSIIPPLLKKHKKSS